MRSGWHLSFLACLLAWGEHVSACWLLQHRTSSSGSSLILESFTPEPQLCTVILPWVSAHSRPCVGSSSTLSPIGLPTSRISCWKGVNSKDAGKADVISAFYAGLNMSMLWKMQWYGIILKRKLYIALLLKEKVCFWCGKRALSCLIGL